MKNFKPNQKVVFSTEKLKFPREVYQAVVPDFILPKEGEVVTVLCKALAPHTNHYVLVEYSKSRHGRTQGIIDTVLFPLEEISSQLTEKLLSDLELKISEPKKVELC